MNPDIKKFGGFVIAALVVILILDFLLGKGLQYFEGKMSGGERARMYHAVHRAKADIFVFGSSRALYHYNPTIMGNALGMEVYNAGRSAQTVLYHLPILKMIIKRHTPKLVILDINENEFLFDQQKYDIANYLLPYYPYDSSVRAVVDVVKPSYKYFSWSKILPYNSSALSMVWRTVRPLKDADDNGYVPVFGHRHKGDSVVNNCRTSYNFDPRIEQAFDGFVRTCRQAGIPLLIVVSPRGSRYQCERVDLQRVSDRVHRLGCTLLDFSASKKYYLNRAWLYDPAHLNYNGSVEFSKDIAEYLQGKQSDSGFAL